MSNLINPKPRFGFNPDTGLLYDYVAQRDVDPTTPPYETVDGTWDLDAVKKAILAGETLDGARIGLPKAPGPVKAIGDPVQNSGSAVPAPPGTPSPAPATAAAAISPEAFKALGLSPLQMAALGISPEAAAVNGITADHVRSWALTPARSDALRLTPAQRKVLLP